MEELYYVDTAFFVCWTLVLIPQQFSQTGPHGPQLYKHYILEKPQQRVLASSFTLLPNQQKGREISLSRPAQPFIS